MKKLALFLAVGALLASAAAQKPAESERSRVIAQSEQLFGPQAHLEHPGDDDVGFSVREDYFAYAKFNPDKTLNVMAFYPKRLERYPFEETAAEQMKAITQLEGDEWLAKADRIKPLGKLETKGAVTPVGESQRYWIDEHAIAMVRYLEVATSDEQGGKRWWLQSIEVFYPELSGKFLVIAKTATPYDTAEGQKQMYAVRYLPATPELIAHFAEVSPREESAESGLGCSVEQELYDRVQKGDIIQGPLYYDQWNICFMRSGKIIGHAPPAPQKPAEKQ